MQNTSTMFEEFENFGRVGRNFYRTRRIFYEVRILKIINFFKKLAFPDVQCEFWLVHSLKMVVLHFQPWWLTYMIISRVFILGRNFASRASGEPLRSPICIKPPSEAKNPSRTLFRKKCVFLTCNANSGLYTFEKW